MNIFKKFTKFLRSVREELKQVTWPGRSELVGSAIVVFTGVIMLAAYISMVDLMLSNAARALLR